MAISSIINNFVKLIIIRNELLHHYNLQKSVQLNFNHDKWGWLFSNFISIVLNLVGNGVGVEYLNNSCI